MDAVQVRNLHKSYNGHGALQGVSFTAGQGEVLAILGPNGAGKTTTIEILQGYLSATTGEVSVLGFTPATAGPALRQRTGTVFQASALYDALTVYETLELFSGYYARARQPRELIDEVDLTTKSRVRVGSLSGGERRRLDFALALVGDPELLFLDEPTTGLDVEVRRKYWQRISAFAAAGKTVILTTHYLEEAQRLADRVVVLNRGTIAAEGAPDDIGKPVTSIRFKLPIDRPHPALPDSLRKKADVRGNAVSLQTEEPETALGELTAWAQEKGVRLENIEVSKRSFEDAYLELLADGRNSKGAH